MSTIPTEIIAMGAKEKGKVEKITYPTKPRAKLDVDLHVLYCGVCATDLHMIQNNWGMSRFPLVPGHEVVGKVLAVGSAVTDIAVGDIVGLGCLAQRCDKCEYCTSTLDNLCNERVFTYFGNTKDETGEHPHYGGFGSYIRTDARGLFHIPKGYSLAHAGPLMCAGITVGAPLYEFGKNSFQAPGKVIGVVGLGGLGHLAVMFASKMNAKDVVVFSRSEDKKKFATELGATKYVDISNKEQMTAAAKTVDYLLVCISGGSFDVAQFAPVMRAYGNIHFVGVPAEELKVNVMALLFSHLSISASPIGSGTQMKAMLEFAAKHDIKPIIEIFPHSKVEEALKKVEDNTIRFRAVLQNDLA